MSEHFAAAVPVLTVEHSRGLPAPELLAQILPAFLRDRRWFAGKARALRAVEVDEVLSLEPDAHLCLVAVRYEDGPAEAYVLPMAVARSRQAAEVLRRTPPVIARLAGADGTDGIVYDGLADPAFDRLLVETIGAGRRIAGRRGVLVAFATAAFGAVAGRAGLPEPALVRAEQSNTSVVYGDRAILKVFRRPEAGTNPDLEVGRFLTERGFPHTPPVAGGLEYHPDRGTPLAVAILHGYVRNQGDAWQHALEAVRDYLDRAVRGAVPLDAVRPPADSPIALSTMSPVQAGRAIFGNYLDAAALLGRRTAELHHALAAEPADPAFAPEPFTRDDGRRLGDEMEALSRRVFTLAARSLPALPEALRGPVRDLLGRQADIAARFRRVADRAVATARIRVHGDYHLGQVLYTGRDFVIIDFEGEPARPLAERRRKTLALRDVAGMLRSFDYAAHAGLAARAGRPAPAASDPLEPWAQAWAGWAAAAFLRGYLAAARGAAFLPRTPEDLETLLEALVLEKAIYELGYELNSRPAWVPIPLRGIWRLLDGRDAPGAGVPAAGGLAGKEGA